MRLLFCLALSIAVAASDRRNTETPNTDTRTEFRAPDTLEAWQARRELLRRQILAAAGLWPAPPKHPLRVLFAGRIEHEGYTIEKAAIETLPGFWLGGNLYRPKGAGPFPAVLHPHGHWPYGRLENSALCSTPLLAVNFARNGFVVFAYDMLGYNDTVQAPHDFTGPAFQLWNFTPLGLQLWNSMRAADFLLSLPDVDPKRLAITGASGGGTQTFLLTAVDDRIAAAAPVNMVSGLMQGGCICENAPGLRIGHRRLDARGAKSRIPVDAKSMAVVRQAGPDRSGAVRRPAQLQPGQPRSGVRVLPQAPGAATRSLERERRHGGEAARHARFSRAPASGKRGFF